MRFFDFFRPPKSSPPSEPPVPTAGIPTFYFDLSKRYDVYVTESSHYDRLYENVLFVGIRTFDRITEYSSGLISGYLEIETADGIRCLLPGYGIRLICEHGAQPAFQIVRHRRNS